MSSVFPRRASSWFVVPLGLAFALFLQAPGLGAAPLAPAPLKDAGAAQTRQAPLPQTILVAQGIVRDRDGKPIKGALIEVAHQSDEVLTLANVEPLRSDEAGRFTVRAPFTPKEMVYLRRQGEDTPQFSVVIYAPGYAVAQKLLQAAKTEGVALPPNEAVLQRGYSASGRVTDKDGKPVAGVRLRPNYATVGNGSVRTADSFVGFYFLTRGSAIARAFETTSDAEGRFTVRDVPLGTTNVLLDDPRYTQDRARITVTDPPTVNDAPTFTARPAARASGRVLYPDGKPAGGVRVVAQGGTERGLETSTVTRPDGTYDLSSIAGGDVVISAVSLSPDWATTSAPTIPLAEGTETKVGDLRIERGVLLTGYAREAGNNAPIGSAIVMVTVEGRNGGSVVTDAQGQYQVRVQPGTISFGLGTISSDYIPSYNRTELKVTVESRTAPTFSLRKGLVLTGTAKDEKGRPAVGAIISPGYGGGAIATVNDKGEWTLRGVDLSRNTDNQGVPNPTLRLKVSGPWALRGNPEMPVPQAVPQAAAQPLALTLAPIALQDVKVRVVTPDGQPISGATVDYKLFYGAKDEGESILRAISDTQGTITLPAMRPEQTAELSATKDGYTLAKEGKVGPFGALDGGVVDGNAEPKAKTGLLRATDIVMTRLDGKITGRVLDDKGQPAQGARIALLYPGDLRDLPDKTVLTDEQGRFALNGLPSGEATIGIALGRTFVQRILNTNDKVLTDLTLGAALPTPPAQDIATAFALLEGWANAERAKPVPQDGGNFGSIAALLAPFDAPRAQRAATDAQGKVDRSFLLSAPLVLAQQDLAVAAALGKTLIPLVTNPEIRANLQLRLAALTVRVAPEEARALYEAASQGVAVDTFNPEAGMRYARLAGLASALKNPDAEGWLQALTLTVNSLTQDGSWYLAQWTALIASGDVAAARQWAAGLPPSQHLSALCALTSWTSRHDATLSRQVLAEAEALVARPDFPADAPRDDRYYTPSASELLNNARYAVVIALMKTDLPAAYQVAQGLASNNSEHRMVRNQIQAQLATAKDEVAMRATLNAVRDGWFDAPGNLAWLAFLLRDTLPQLSAQAFQEARENLGKRNATLGPSDQSVALYAYARADLDPAASRLLLENEWLRTKDTLRRAKTPDDAWEPTWALRKIALAMIPLDVNRANAMIVDNNVSDQYSYATSSARRQMLRWLLADAKTRRTMSLEDPSMFFDGTQDIPD